ncbi:TonB-dependent receptor [Sandaracinobacter sp. RS1-74]|uniref:TonB-dependent receptor plug domain-containing protein n=1 Tax=Sandaracinobacteroides sayramensis TaxID=2913411 RepID=UPI001EDBC449|nr:TonB-dependent receptor [Sandaracinobacteroides sayramensis]MCG2841612.1 TonB-dependent receptor [Sandaracinobacteroides sayramensis]
MAFGLLLGVSLQPAHAETDGEIWVTAARDSVPAERLPAALTVLDKARIDRAGDFAVADLLLRTPGVSLSRNGGYGTATSLRIRGAESDQTVVLMDGVKLNDPSSAGGGYNFAHLMVGDAVRIEVLRGPQSILWGSQAIGGVVSVETPLPSRAVEASVDLEAGSRQTVSARAALGERRGPLSIRIAAQSFSTAGISAIGPEFGGREPDSYSNRSLSGRAVLELAPNVRADVRGYHSSGRTEIDAVRGDSAEYALSRESTGYAGLAFDLLDSRWRNRLGVSRTATDRDNYDPARERRQSFDARGTNERLEYQGNLSLGAVEALFGAEREISRFRSVSPPAALSRPVPEPARGRAAVESVYGQLSAQPFSGLTLTGGLRHDGHDGYGGQLLGAAGAVWTTPLGGSLRASWSEGFKAPTLYQRFSEYGNAALEPEQARGWEVGAEQPLADGRLLLGANWYERRSSNLIVFMPCPASTSEPLCFVPGGAEQRRSGYYQNVSRAFAKGLEAMARVRAGAFLLEGHYDLSVSEDRATGLQLPRRPRHGWHLGASYLPASGLALGGSVRGVGETFDNASHGIRLKPYTLVDLRAELPLSPEVRLVLRADNVFDTDYQTAYRYGTLGRSVYAGVRGRF